MLTKKTTILTLLNAGLFLTFNVEEVYYIFRLMQKSPFFNQSEQA